MKKVGIAVLTGAVFLLAGCGGTDYTKLEKELTQKASDYYETNMSKVYKVNQFSITLQALEQAKVDITNFTKNGCDKTSYALVKVKLDDNGKPIGNYTVENHLTCGSYKTATK